MLRNELSADALLPEGTEVSSVEEDWKEPFAKEGGVFNGNSSVNSKGGNHVNMEKYDRSKRIPFEQYKRRTTVVVGREKFLDVICNALSDYKYVGPNQRGDLILACRYIDQTQASSLVATYGWYI